MRTEYALSGRCQVEEAADWLQGMGFMATTGSDPERHRLVVHDHTDTAGEVRRAVQIVDPAAAQIG
jgi:hypothetical protein